MSSQHARSQQLNAGLDVFSAAGHTTTFVQRFKTTPSFTEAQYTVSSWNSLKRDLARLSFIASSHCPTDPAMNYTDLSGAPPTTRRPYYKTQYSNDETLASIDITSCGDMSDNKVQIADFLKVSARHPQELNSWTTRYSKMPTLSQVILKVWSLSPSPKYTAACS